MANDVFYNLYSRQPTLLVPMLAYQGCGSVQTGRFQGKMIVVDSLLDESAFPWFADWYHRKVQENLGDQIDDQRLLAFQPCAAEALSIHVIA